MSRQIVKIFMSQIIRILNTELVDAFVYLLHKI